MAEQSEQFTSAVCCQAFMDKAPNYRQLPDQWHAVREGFTRDGDGAWAVYGCCGGGCYVLTGVQFCPFCGSALPSTPRVAAEREIVDDEDE